MFVQRSFLFAESHCGPRRSKAEFKCPSVAGVAGRQLQSTKLADIELANRTHAAPAAVRSSAPRRGAEHTRGLFFATGSAPASLQGRRRTPRSGLDELEQRCEQRRESNEAADPPAPVWCALGWLSVVYCTALYCCMTYSHVAWCRAGPGRMEAAAWAPLYPSIFAKCRPRSS